MHTKSLIRPGANDDVTVSMPTLCAAFWATAARHPDRVAVLLPNRPEHLVADLPALHLAATPFTSYATSAPQIEYVLRDSGARVLRRR